MVYAFYDGRLPEVLATRLRAEGFFPVAVPRSNNLSEPVCAHVDLSMAVIGSQLLVSRDAPRRVEILRELPHVFVSDDEPAPSYPEEARFCVFSLGGCVYGTRDSSHDVRLLAQREGLSFVPVRQGYAACNVLRIDEGHAVTADRGLYRVLTQHGIDVLLVREGGVRLSPYDYGFIGGAGGVFGDTVYLLGELSLHPDGERIQSYIEGRGKRIRSLLDGELIDGGGIVFFGG